MKRKKIFIIFALVLIFTIIFFGKVNSINNKKLNNLEFVILPEFQNYFLKEDIWIKVQLTNNTNSEFIFFNNFNFGSIDFKITLPDGKIVDKIINEDEYLNYRDSSKIKQNELIENDVELGYYFPNGTKIPGEYRISATFQGIKSNEIIITIIEPMGNEKDVYEKIEIALGSSNEEKHFENSTKRLEDLLERYPNSRYSPQLCNYLFSKLSYTGYDETGYSRIENNLSKYMQYNSNRLGTNFIIPLYCFCLSKFENWTSEQIVGKLTELSNVYKGTNTEKIITNYLNETIAKRNK